MSPMRAAPLNLMLFVLAVAWIVMPSASNSSRDGGWRTLGSLAEPGPCTIARVHTDNLTTVEFIDRYAFREPVLIEGVDSNEAFRRECTRHNLLTAYGNRFIQLTTATSASLPRSPVSLRHYIEHMMEPQELLTPANESLYHFGDTDREQWKSVFDLYNFPIYTLPGMAPMISFGLAGAGTGVPMHFHGPTFAEVIYGRKRWFFQPPTNDFRYTAASHLSMLQWYAEKYPLLRGPAKPLECTLERGQIIYIPDRWWHSTLNIDESVFVSTFLALDVS